MKRTDTMKHIGRAFMALVVMGAIAGCNIMDYGDCPEDLGGDGRLSVRGTVSDGTVVTRAEAVADLKEKDLNTLDVFVEHVTDGVGDGTFMKQYHLKSSDKAIVETTENLLAKNWRAEGLKIGEKYNIYLATNNPLTKTDVESVEALKGLVYDEVTDSVAVLTGDEYDNVTWGETTTSGNIYKLYNANPGNARALTSDKKFMMDGVLKNWTPVPNSRDQVFKDGNKGISLNRAAAKIVLNVAFDADFVTSLKKEKKTVDGVETWVDKPADQQVTIVGTPAWKFYNFAFGAPVFDPRNDDVDGGTPTPISPVEVHNSDFNIFHNQSCENGASFQIITYTYPNAWVQADYSTKAPSLVVSIGFKQGTGDNAVTTYNYYRIPLVKSTVTEIERNHIYVVNATIATRGSELHEDTTELGDNHYYVLPWNDESNSAAIHNEVEAVQHKYLKVNPKIYTLRGDGAQSVDINYLKASGTSVGWKLFTYDANGDQTAIVANNATGATRAWFYNSIGAFTSTYSDTGSGVAWGNTMGVDITQSTEGVSGTSGKFTVTSQALTNKAIKYIRFRVFLNEEETLFEDVIIRHFPTDNIQNIYGLWSSRYNTGGSTTTVTLTTETLSEAQSWAEEYGVEIESETKTVTDDISYATYIAHSEDEGYAIVSAPTITNSNVFRTYVQNVAQRAAANGQINSVLGEDGYCYWGENPIDQGWNYSDYSGYYDYYNETGSYYGYTVYHYYNYTTIYRAHYTHTRTYTEYSVTVDMPSTGQWVDWDRDAGKTYNQSNVKYTRGNNFTAKVYDESRSRIYAIEPTRSGGQGNRQYTYGIADGYESGDYYVYTTGGDWTTSGNMDLTNNHMYVIQISSTSDDYVLGRPYVNQNTHQSQDDVVSPAFMIASQLGAVTQFTGNNAASNAADHCDSYMEVSKDGTRYTGWRLPTQSEIKVIVGYQEGEIDDVTILPAYQTIAPVLTGALYWCLSGNRIRTSDNEIVTTGNAYLRCVRDLSAEEIERLNGFDKIVAKYQNK